MSRGVFPGDPKSNPVNNGNQPWQIFTKQTLRSHSPRAKSLDWRFSIVFSFCSGIANNLMNSCLFKGGSTSLIWAKQTDSAPTLSCRGVSCQTLKYLLPPYANPSTSPWMFLVMGSSLYAYYNHSSFIEIHCVPAFCSLAIMSASDEIWNKSKPVLWDSLAIAFDSSEVLWLPP